MQDQIFNFKDNIAIQYRFIPAKRDCRHLLIIMSGFNIPDPTIYDFTMMDHCHSSILWIKDDFGGLPAYYLCRHMSFDIEKGVSLLINGVIGFVKPENVSILGASKGGSAALYFGLKHRFKNIITAVPQFHIGRYVAQGYWEHIGNHMMGNITSKNTKLLDLLILNQIMKDKDKHANIYLFTSPDDKQYLTEIEPNIQYLKAYKNFNLIETHSSFATEHNKITAYNLNVILSIVYQLENNITPKLGHVRNGDGWCAEEKGAAVL